MSIAPRKIKNSPYTKKFKEDVESSIKIANDFFNKKKDKSNLHLTDMAVLISNINPIELKNENSKEVFRDFSVIYKTEEKKLKRSVAAKINFFYPDLLIQEKTKKIKRKSFIYTISSCLCLN